jgi:hypothetical protein
MPEPVFFRVVDEFTPSSNSEQWFRLPTFALSYLNIAVRMPQPAANQNITIENLVNWISRISVFVRGASIFDADGLAAWVIGSLLFCRKPPFLKRPIGSTSSRHEANIYVPFSRKPLMPTSGIKPVAQGESLLYMRFGTVPTGAKITIGAVGWRENQPEWTVRVSRYTQSVSATGPGDLILAPVGPILGFIFREDNPKETADTSILEEIRLLIQGVEDTLISYDVDLLIGDQAITTYANLITPDHQHVENTAAAYTQNALTQSAQTGPLSVSRFMPLLLDEMYDPDAVIAVPPGADVRLRYTATGTGTLDVYLVEMFVIPERAPAGTPA